MRRSGVRSSSGPPSPRQPNPQPAVQIRCAGAAAGHCRAQGRRGATLRRRQTPHSARCRDRTRAWRGDVRSRPTWPGLTGTPAGWFQAATLRHRRSVRLCALFRLSRGREGFDDRAGSALTRMTCSDKPRQRRVRIAQLFHLRFQRDEPLPRQFAHPRAIVAAIEL